jgi:hypothetical protein
MDNLRSNVYYRLVFSIHLSPVGRVKLILSVIRPYNIGLTLAFT